MKQKKPANLPQERLGKPIPSKTFFHCNQKSAIHLEPMSILPQTIKRPNTNLLKFSSSAYDEERPKRFSQLLGQAIGFNKNARELILSIPSNFTDQDLLYLTHGLKRLKSLERITLDIDSCTNKRLYHLMKGLKRLCLLKSFSLNVRYADKVSDVGLKYVSKSIKKMVLLKDVHLDFSAFIQRIDEGMFEVSGSFNHLKKLEDITLKIDDCPEMTDRSLANMRLKRLVSLRKINLEFVRCERLSDKITGFMAQGLKNHPNLQSFKLRLYGCPELTFLGLQEIWRILNSLPSLKRAKLEFPESWNITSVIFYTMKFSLKCLGMLQKFSIRLNSCSATTDESLVDLCQALEKAVSLQDLTVYLGGSERITDTGVKEVINCMKKLTHLKRVGLGFPDMEKVTDTSLREMSQFFQSQTSLKKIRLSGREMGGTTHEGASEFNQVIDDLEKQRPGLKIKYIN